MDKLRKKEVEYGKRKKEINRRTTTGTQIPDFYHCHFGYCSFDDGSVFNIKILK
jgi:hypothetical protein